MSRHRFARVLAAAVVAAVVVCAAPLDAGREPRSLPRARGLRAVEVIEIAWRWLTGRWMEEGVIIDPNGVKPTEPPPKP